MRLRVWPSGFFRVRRLSLRIRRTIGPPHAYSTGSGTLYYGRMVAVQSIDERSPHLEAVKQLWRAHSDTLGFMPSGAFTDYARERHILVAADGAADDIEYCGLPQGHGPFCPKWDASGKDCFRSETDNHRNRGPAANAKLAQYPVPGHGSDVMLPADEFWRRYDAGEFRK